MTDTTRRIDRAMLLLELREAVGGLEQTMGIRAAHEDALLHVAQLGAEAPGRYVNNYKYAKREEQKRAEACGGFVWELIQGCSIEELRALMQWVALRFVREGPVGIRTLAEAFERLDVDEQT